MARPGRKPKAGKREPNGKLSRRKEDVMDRVNGTLEREEREALRPGIEARIRIHGIDAKDSRDPKAGCFVGRLCMGKELTQRQFEAAMLFLEDHRNNAMAIAAPRDPSGVDLNRVQGGSLAGESVEFYRKATQRWRNACAAVQDRQNELRGAGAIYAALEACVLRDAEAHHMVGWLREGLNALARYYGLGDKAKAA